MSNHCADVVVHIDEELDDEQIHGLEKDLARFDGIYSACVHEKARHLMLIDFDPEDVDPVMLLDEVEAHGMHAELIGL